MRDDSVVFTFYIELLCAPGITKPQLKKKRKVRAITMKRQALGTEIK